MPCQALFILLPAFVQYAMVPERATDRSIDAY